MRSVFSKIAARVTGQAAPQKKHQQMKVVLAPMNIANMPMQVVNALRARGHVAEQVHFHNGQGHAFGFPLDVAPNQSKLGGRIAAHTATLRDYLDRDFDIFHFWNKTLFFNLDYGDMTGFDVPLIKARGKRVVHRFTGFDLRLPSWDKKANPYSPHNYGYEHLFDEKLQMRFIDFMSEHVDRFVVQDPEMAQFAPKRTTILPRALDLTQWDPIGVARTDRPLVVHAPSNPAVKGTKYVLQAVDELQAEGLQFDFKLIERMQHEEAKSWYRRADIIVDQLMIGATGVLTLEAWALGKPVVVNLRADLFNPFYKTTDLPICNANPDTVKAQLRKLISDQDWRDDLAKRGRKLVEDFHDMKQVMNQFEAFYLDLLGRPATKPTGTMDLPYLELQAEMSSRMRVQTTRQEKTIAEQTARIAALEAELAALNSAAPEPQGATNTTAKDK